MIIDVTKPFLDGKNENVRSMYFRSSEGKGNIGKRQSYSLTVVFILF